MTLVFEWKIQSKFNLRSSIGLKYQKFHFKQIMKISFWIIWNQSLGLEVLSIFFKELIICNFFLFNWNIPFQPFFHNNLHTLFPSFENWFPFRFPKICSLSQHIYYYQHLKNQEMSPQLIYQNYLQIANLSLQVIFSYYM